EHALTIGGAHAGVFHLWIDMTIDGEYVRPAVVVIVKKARSPTDVRRADRSDFGSIGHVREEQGFFMTVESGVLAGKIRDENTKVAGVDAGRDGDAHGAEGNAIVV